jgi:hypothetical protein
MPRDTDAKSYTPRAVDLRGGDQVGEAPVQTAQGAFGSIPDAYVMGGFGQYASVGVDDREFGVIGTETRCDHELACTIERDDFGRSACGADDLTALADVARSEQLGHSLRKR